jgi:hypothetical protein
MWAQRPSTRLETGPRVKLNSWDRDCKVGIRCRKIQIQKSYFTRKNAQYSVPADDLFIVQTLKSWLHYDVTKPMNNSFWLIYGNNREGVVLHNGNMHPSVLIPLVLHMKEVYESMKNLKVKKYSYPCNRPWRPKGLWDVEHPTFSRQSAHIWR